MSAKNKKWLNKLLVCLFYILHYMHIMVLYFSFSVAVYKLWTKFEGWQVDIYQSLYRLMFCTIFVQLLITVNCSTKLLVKKKTNHSLLILTKGVSLSFTWNNQTNTRNNWNVPQLLTTSGYFPLKQNRTKALRQHILNTLSMMLKTS